MYLRTVLAAAVLATVATFPLAGVASAQPQPTDRDCRDFASQAAAQSALRSHSGDPQRLDANHNGVACEDYFRMGQVDPEVPPPPAAPVQPVADTEPDPGVIDPPAAAAPDAPVRTVPEHQILVKPVGAADTGDGSAAPTDPVPVVLLLGGLGAAVALGVRRWPARR
ncbi:excalibur calcium-binding domain-containing protein [Pseudonocardia charpentierae]|uniref:Excalibur calcium-binding domain-containing protein n=1 Tax=Pseudonocardia charpentierae TaxID=3075545 RepID=A0ABU2N8N1_9PSEU|nr:excalibur calcium-binding domain-containing protein [Pseudonocardia sp. DSM 45834]MDT0349858.1 excalibur calcium-binding domain-containing protein [Pseudonocardia sp. DSM 45834]